MGLDVVSYYFMLKQETGFHCPSLHNKSLFFAGNVSVSHYMDKVVGGSFQTWGQFLKDS